MWFSRFREERRRKKEEAFGQEKRRQIRRAYIKLDLLKSRTYDLESNNRLQWDIAKRHTWMNNDRLARQKLVEVREKGLWINRREARIAQLTYELNSIELGKSVYNLENLIFTERDLEKLIGLEMEGDKVSDGGYASSSTKSIIADDCVETNLIFDLYVEWKNKNFASSDINGIMERWKKSNIDTDVVIQSICKSEERLLDLMMDEPNKEEEE